MSRPVRKLETGMRLDRAGFGSVMSGVTLTLRSHVWKMEIY